MQDDSDEDEDADQAGGKKKAKVLINKMGGKTNTNLRSAPTARSPLSIASMIVDPGQNSSI